MTRVPNFISSAKEAWDLFKLKVEEKLKIFLKMTILYTHYNSDNNSNNNNITKLDYNRNSIISINPIKINPSTSIVSEANGVHHKFYENLTRSDSTDSVESDNNLNNEDHESSSSETSDDNSDVVIVQSKILLKINTSDLKKKENDVSIKYETKISEKKFMKKPQHFKSENVAKPACWKFDPRTNTCYIDVEEDSENEDEATKEYSQWNYLPDILLEKVFGYLSVRERYYASLVCKNWYYGFHMPPVWSNFIVDDRTLTRPKYNYYSGWHYVLDHNRTQNCLLRVGRYIKGLEFRPEHSFQNLFQFMTLFSWCMDKAQAKNCPPELTGIGAKVKSLKYVFPCNQSQTEDPQGIKLFGTGGQLLQVLKTLLSKLTNLQILSLVDLVLERYEANHLLDEVLDSCCTVLTYLNLVNVTTVHCPIMHVGLFLNLKILVISPQNIDDDVLQLIADTKLKHLHLYQNRYTPPFIGISCCSAKAWRNLKRDNPELKVHIRVESCQDNEFVFQPEAPVHSILYDSPKTQITPELMLRISDNYKRTLSIYGHESLPSFSSPKSFQDRIDSLLLLLVRECCFMNTLVIREKISSGTVLLLAHHARNLNNFYIRRAAVILKCEWPQNPEWSDEFFEWLKTVSKSYEAVEKEVSQIIGKPWSFLTDQQYKQIEIEVRQEYL